MNLDLYRTSPEYRRVVDDLYRTRQELGALEAAYQNAQHDQGRLRALLEQHGVIHRDDPGSGGSGGAR